MKKIESLCRKAMSIAKCHLSVIQTQKLAVGAGLLMMTRVDQQ